MVPDLATLLEAHPSTAGREAALRARLDAVNYRLAKMS
jgi:hypothetical protein